MEKNKIDLNSFLILLLFSLSIFLWSFKPFNFQFRFLYLALLIQISYFYFFKIKKYNFSILIWHLVFFLVIFFINFKSILISPKLIYSNILIFLTIIIVFYYWRYLKNIDYLIGIFLSIFFISIIVTGEALIPVIYGNAGNWNDKCGGITLQAVSLIPYFNYLLPVKEFLFNLEGFQSFSIVGQESHPSTIIGRLQAQKVNFKEILFKENSHVSLIAPFIILYLIYRVQNLKKIFIGPILVLSIFLIFYIKSTSIFFIGTILSFIVIYSFNYNKFNKKITIIYFFLICLLGYNFMNDLACKKRYFFISHYITNKVESLNLKLKNNLQKNNSKKLDSKYQSLLDEGHIDLDPLKNVNLSVGVMMMSLEVTIKSIKNNPWGVGFNNYSDAHNHFNKKNDLNYHKNYFNSRVIEDLNASDASSTLLKMLVELGLFNIIIFSIIFLYIYSNKIPIEEKLFYFPLIFTQFIRGVGYFNSGFLIILIFISLSYFNRKN